MGCSILSKLDSALEREGGESVGKQKLVQLFFLKRRTDPWEGSPALRLYAAGFFSRKTSSYTRSVPSTMRSAENRSITRSRAACPSLRAYP